MATITHEIRVDDLNPEVEGDEVQRITFALDGAEYEIDLCPSNQAKMLEALAPWAKVARPITKARRVSKSTRSKQDRERASEIREWARSQGIPVSQRGRIPEEIMARWSCRQK